MEYNNRDLYQNEIGYNNEYDQVVASDSISPLAVIANNSMSEMEQENRKKWERIGAYTALSGIFTAVGNGLAATSGVKTSPIDLSYIDNATKQIVLSDSRQRENYNNIYKDTLKEALRQQENEKESTKTYLNRLSSLSGEDVKYDIADMKMESDTFRDEKREEARMDRLQEQYKLKDEQTTNQIANTSSSKAGVNASKANRIVYNNLGQKVSLMDEDVTKLFHAAKIYKLTGPYDQSPSDYRRAQEFDLMIQQAYLIKELEEAQINENNN